MNASACSSCIHLPKPDPTPFAATSLRRARQLGDGERAWHIAGVFPANERTSREPHRPEEEGKARAARDSRHRDDVDADWFGAVAAEPPKPKAPKPRRPRHDDRSVANAGYLNKFDADFDRAMAKSQQLR